MTDPIAPSNGLWLIVRNILTLVLQFKRELRGMKRIKIRFANRDDTSIIMDVIKHGQVVCLRDNIFIVPEPAIKLLNELGAKYENLGEESWDSVVRTLRAAATS